MKKLDSLTLPQVMWLSNVLCLTGVALLLLGGAVAKGGTEISMAWIVALCILAIILVIAGLVLAYGYLRCPPLRRIFVPGRPRAYEVASLLSPLRQAAG